MEQIKAFLTPDNIVNFTVFIIKPLILLLVCKVIINMLLRVYDNIFTKTKLDKGIQTFGKSALRIGLWLIAIIMVAGAFGVDTASLVAVLGVASLALSLAVQGIFTNVFSGIAILVTKPFVVGDFVETCGVTGVVKAIELMRTTIVTPDNKIELLPNGDINASRITNYSTEEYRRVDKVFTASYNNSTDDVKKAIMEVIDADTRINQDKGVTIRLSEFNSSDISYTVRVWVKNADYWDVYFDLIEGVRESYAKYGIEFAYPHTVVMMSK